MFKLSISTPTDDNSVSVAVRTDAQLATLTGILVSLGCICIAENLNPDDNTPL